MRLVVGAQGWREVCRGGGEKSDVLQRHDFI